MNYLIWDFDGTLGFREGSMWSGTLHKIVRRAMPELAVSLEQVRGLFTYPWHTPEKPHTDIRTADEWWARFDPVLLGVLAQIGVPGERAPGLAREFRAAYVDTAHWRLYDDTLPTLKRLSEAGWTHILLSNHVPELPSILSHLGLLPLLKAVFNSAETGYEKPHPRAFRNVLDFIGEHENVWMIGDNYTADILGAQPLGIPAILVRTEHPQARHRCAELSAIMGIISQGAWHDQTA